jgi:hypothetical protein
MEIRKRVLGADHPSTLISIANLASVYRNQGRRDTAEETEMQVMETKKNKLGADHPSTLTSMNNLALTWKEQGRDKEALRLMEECVTLRARMIGNSHPDSLFSRKILLRWQTECSLDYSGGSRASISVCAWFNAFLPPYRKSCHLAFVWHSTPITFSL